MLIKNENSGIMYSDEVAVDLSDKKYKYREGYFLIMKMLRSNDKRIIGIRGLRSIGKTTIMKQLAAVFKESIFISAVAFSEIHQDFSTNDTIDYMKNVINEKECKYVFIDEINYIGDINISLRLLLDELYDRGIKVVFTSSSPLLVDKAVRMEGLSRARVINIGELSFQEYLRFTNNKWKFYYIGEQISKINKIEQDIDYNSIYDEYMYKDKRPAHINSTIYSSGAHEDTVNSVVKSIVGEELAVFDFLSNTDEDKNELYAGAIELLYILAYKKAERYTMIEYAGSIKGKYDNEIRSAKITYNNQIAAVGKIANKLNNAVLNRVTGKMLDDSTVLRIIGLFIRSGIVSIEITVSKVDEYRSDNVDIARILDGLESGGYFRDETTGKNVKHDLQWVLDRYNFNLTSTTVYGAIVSDFINSIGLQNVDVKDICDNIIKGTVLEAALKSEYVRYMNIPYSYKFNGIVESKVRLDIIINQYKKNIDRESKEIARIEQKINKGNVNNIEKVTNVLNGKKEQVAEWNKELSICLHEKSMNVEYHIKKKDAEVDLIENTVGHKFACEMSVYNKDNSRVNLKYLGDGVKLLTTKDIDNIDDDTSIGKVQRLRYGKSAIYLDARALARFARNNNLEFEGV